MKYFNLSEFDSPDSPGSGKKMCPAFLFLLDNARDIYGKKMRITSGYRTKAYNEELRKKGYASVKNSAHLIGCASDVACEDTFAIEMLNAFWIVGFRRFGIMNSAIHVDIDTSKPRPSIWSYGNEETPRWKLAKEWFNQKIKTI
jgi:hypothetical protein